MNYKLFAAGLALGFALIWAPALDASSDNGKPNGNKNNKPGKHQNQGSKREAAHVFSPLDRDVISDYYRVRSSNIPPGLAKRRSLTPGHQRQLERNGTLPPGLQKRIDPFPRELNYQLPPLSPGYSRGFVDGSAVIFDRRTGAIADIIHNLLNSAGR